MRVLQINYSDLAGKRFNGFELNKQLRKKGIKSNMAVWIKESNDKYTELISTKSNSKEVQRRLNSIEYGLSIQSLLYPFAVKFILDDRFKKADIVHYHLIYPNFLSLLALPALSKLKPSIWTLHDPWPLTGHCVHPLDCQRWKIGCGKCPYLSTTFEMRRDNTRMMWKIKKLIYGLSNFEIVVATKWMQERVRNSPLMKRFNIHLIPFGVDINKFKPGNSVQVKKSLGIDPNNLVVTVRSTPDMFKGFVYAKEALKHLQTKRKITLLSLGQYGMMKELEDKYQVIEMGWVDLDELLLKAYQATDILLMPSVAESFGMMAVEAMACEKVVLGFSGTALEDTVFSPKGGVIVYQKDVTALVEAMKMLINSPSRRRNIGKIARNLVKKNFSLKNYTDKHIKLYQMAVDNYKPR